MPSRVETVLAKARDLLTAFGSDSIEKTIWGSPAGKKKIADRLAAMLPPHDTYVEPFAGSAAVLFAKEPSLVEAINDADPEIAEAYALLKRLTKRELARLREMAWTGDEATFRRCSTRSLRIRSNGCTASSTSRTSRTGSSEVGASTRTRRARRRRPSLGSSSSDRV